MSESSSNIWFSEGEDDEIVQHLAKCNDFIGQLLTNQQEPSIRRGSVPGRRVINREREEADQGNGGIADTGIRSPADATDEYIRIGESTAIECVKRFCRAVIEVFGEEYLRSPTLLMLLGYYTLAKNVASRDAWQFRLYALAMEKLSSSMGGPICRKKWRPNHHFRGRGDYDLWIWHAYFGMPGSNNDINVLESSNLFGNLAEGIAPPANYVIQGKEYNMGYYLADGIYPKWATLVQTIHEPRGRKKCYFAKKQEAYRKDVERAFGTLQAQFAIVAAPARFWHKRDLHNIMTACIIMHNMIVDDERDLDAPIQEAMEAPPPNVEMVDENTRFEQFLERHRRIRNREAHFALRDALIDHLWDEYTNSDD